jgi:hypothetical protein
LELRRFGFALWVARALLFRQDRIFRIPHLALSSNSKKNCKDDTDVCWFHFMCWDLQLYLRLDGLLEWVERVDDHSDCIFGIIIVGTGIVGIVPKLIY